METQRFDQMTAALGTGSSRRRVLGGFGVAVGLLLGRDLDVAANKNKKSKAKKAQARKDRAAVTLEAKAECDLTSATEGDALCQAKVAGTCLTGTCSKPVRESRYRCVYTRSNSLCTDPAAPICCNYRLTSPTSGTCVAKGEYCAA
jgi:hypothetical protein